MTDGQVLFLTFLVLYLVESLRWLPPRAVLFVGRANPECWHWVSPFSRFSFRGRAAVFLPLLPPLCAWRITCEWKFVPEKTALRIVGDDAGSVGWRIPWIDLSPVADDTNLRLTPELTVPINSAAETRRLVSLLRQWKDLPPADREKAFLEEARRSLQSASLKASVMDAAHQTRYLRWLGSGILIWCYGVITWLYTWLGENVWLYIAVAFLFVLMLAQAAMFAMACRRQTLAGGAPVRWKVIKMLGMMLFPPMAIRAADHLLILQDAASHPLACRELVHENVWQKKALSTWRMFRYQPGWQTEKIRPEAQALERFFDEQNVDIDAYDTPPILTPAAPNYCPRCQATFVASAKECADCNGLELVISQAGSERS